MIDMDFNKINLTWVEIDLDKLIENVHEIRRLTDKKAEITAVIKANAYGHGATEIAPILLNNGVSRLAVARLDEAIELRFKGITAPILVLGAVFAKQAELAVLYGIDVTIFDYKTAKSFSDEAVKQQRIIRIHIKIDSGMGRIGYRIDEDYLKEIKSISNLPNVILEGIFTHFATADSLDKNYTKQQYERFRFICNELIENNIKVNTCHCANSATIIDLPQYHQNMVRAGIILYGLYPSKEVDIFNIKLKPIMSLKCKITYIKKIKKGDSISYGRKFIADKDCKIATLPIGYADGYTRLLSGKAQVLIHGHRASIVGNICMDQCMVDISNIPDVKRGDEAVLFGNQGEECITVDELAEKIGTINYEVVCMIARRVPRVYKRNNEIIYSKNYLF